MSPKRASESILSASHCLRKTQIHSHDLPKELSVSHTITDQCLIAFPLDRQASAGEIPANRSHPGLSAGQRGGAWAADGGGGDDHCSWKTTAGCLTASYQQVGEQIQSVLFSTGESLLNHLFGLIIVLFPSRLDSAENQVDETIFLIESYVNSTTTTSWEHFNIRLKISLVTFCVWMLSSMAVL